MQRSLSLIRFGVVIALALASAPALIAQQATVGLAGRRVRLVLRNGDPVIGRLQETGADSYVIAPGGRPEATARFAASNVSRVEMSVGRHSAAGQGAGVGAVAFGALALLGVATDDNDFVGSETGYEVAAVIGSVAIGGGLGALVGAFIHSERWQEVELVRPTPVSLLVQPREGRVRVGLSLGTRRSVGPAGCTRGFGSDRGGRR